MAMEIANRDYAEVISLRLSRELAQGVRVMAARNERTISAQIRLLIREAVADSRKA